MQRLIRFLSMVFRAFNIAVFIVVGLMMISSVVLVHRAEKTREEHLQTLKEAKIRAKEIARKNWTVVSVSVDEGDQTSRFVAQISLKDRLGQKILLKIPSSHEAFSQFCQLKPVQRTKLRYSDRMLAIDRGGGKESIDLFIARFLIPKT